MFWPMTMGMAAPTVTCPLAARACNIPTEAELDWITAVSTAPASTPSRGLPKAVNSCRNPSATNRAFSGSARFTSWFSVSRA